MLTQVSTSKYKKRKAREKKKKPTIRMKKPHATFELILKFVKIQFVKSETYRSTVLGNQALK